ncbi:Hypothetical protein PHPALM_6645 [Phytophthora palmivora]|uniref:Uncharacterized protein n=1 Tax=Phytophthora palmivora TaxID=4796 RepID=A0A2P4YED0_9STRA|nr:Hypothetical protein PHPALM_6645 [Phytophthora palmivora]
MRMPKPSSQMGMALLLDPRTKKAAKSYLRLHDTSEVSTDKLLTETKALLLKEHRNSASSSPLKDISATFDDNIDLLCGEEVSQQSDVNSVEDALNKEADAEVERWLNFRIEWAEVAKLQIANDTNRKQVLAKLTMRNREKKNIWNVEQLCQHIDGCRKYLPVGRKTCKGLVGTEFIYCISGMSIFDWFFCYELT